jgi:ketosteroid isomerase-like protein
MLSDPSLTISWKAQHAEIASSGDIGYTCGTYELSMKGLDGKPINDKGKFLCVWKKQSNAKWKALRDMWNSDLK